MVCIEERPPAAAVMDRPNWFLALPLPPCACWQEVAASAPSPLRRFAPEDLHCTLAFLGACGEQRAIAAWQALSGLQVSPIPIRAGGWRALGPARQPSAYGLTLAEGHAPLCALLQRWESVAHEAAGLRPSVRPPLPHLTLLRPKRREAARVLEPMRAWMAQAPLPQGAALLQELALYTWDPERRERLFRVTHRRPLGPR
jgi:2'-5' RNA ligase